jgi:hypothetical protein
MLWDNKNALNEILSEIAQDLPEEIENIGFVQGPGREVMVLYSGSLSPRKQILLRRNIRKRYGIDLTFSKRLSGETEDSLQVDEDDA